MSRRAPQDNLRDDDHLSRAFGPADLSTDTLAFLSLITGAAFTERDPDRFIESVEQMLGERLEASRVLFAEASPDGREVIVRQDWTRDLPSIVGTHRIADFGKNVAADFKAGRLHVSRDSEADYEPGEGLESIRAIGARAGVSVPVLDGGTLRAIVVVHQSTPRDWSAQELTLIRQVADRMTAEIERAQSNRALRLSEARFRALVASTSDVLYHMSPDWAEMRQLSGGGFIEDTATASSTWLTDYIVPEDQPTVRAEIARAIKARGTFELEHRVRRVDGGVGWTLSRAVPLFDERGEIAEWFGVAVDVTDRVLARQAIERSEAQMRAALAEAEFAGRMKDEFLATLSHELRTPLSAILGYSQLLRRESVKPEALANGLATIERNARAQTQIIEDLLDMSRIISGKVALDAQPIDAGDVIRAAIETVRATAIAKSIDLRFDPPTDERFPATADFNRCSGTCCRTRSSSPRRTAQSSS